MKSTYYETLEETGRYRILINRKFPAVIEAAMFSYNIRSSLGTKHILRCQEE